MKKTYSFLSSIIFSGLFFYACNSGGSGEAYTLKMRLNPGDTFHHEINMQMVTNTAGMETKMNMESGCLFEVNNSDTGGKKLKMTYTNMHMGLEMNKISGMNMDSILNRVNNKAMGKSVILTLSKDNQITNVDGIENLMNDSTADATTRQTMQKMFSKDQLNNIFGMMFSMYPDKPVKIGESWKASTTMNMGGMMDMKINITYTLKSVKNGLAEIDANGIIGGKGQMNQQGRSFEMDMSGEQKGAYTIKIETGYLDHAEYKMNIKADMEMMGQKIPITINADCTMKGM